MFRQTDGQIDGEITIRRLRAADGGALERLAERDSAAVPEGTVYGAVDAEGSILAAVSLESRALVADPFVHSAHAAALLRVWVGQLDGAPRARWTRGGLAVAQPAAAPTASPC
jgi:hypothetical protein